MSEQDPKLIIKVNSNDYEMNRRNSFLYTFLGDLAIHDHIFLVTNPEENEGTFIFKVIYQQEFDELSLYMINNHFTAHLNAQQVSECDADAFDRATMGDVRQQDSFPEEWNDGTAA
jgi:hypothetical protein